jgi:alpha-tubulin suppressor-like RCC1 family protein
MAVTLRLLVFLLAFMTVAAGQVAPAFTTQPINQTAVIGGNVTFTVAASGTAPLAYQWYKDGIAVAGATGSSLTINGVKTSDFGSYKASVNNATTLIRAVAAGGNNTLYVKSDGTLWAMGSNDYGQLGDGTTTGRSTAVQVATGVASVSAGGYHSLYVKTDGTLWAMGLNGSGQLGDGTTTRRLTPVQVATGVASVSTSLASGVSDFYGGNGHTLYVKTDGTLWAMGRNQYGQLGDGTTTGRSTAVQVATGVASVTAGPDHTLYVKTDGTLWAMGYNQYYQLGDGTATNRSTPVPMALGATSASARTLQTYYVKTDGTLWAMGLNSEGQLGDGTTTDRRTPANINTGLFSDAAFFGLPAAITTQPSATSVIVGSAASFTAVASGTALTYQWKKDGVAISGATAATYRINFSLLADTGSYTVTVTNSLGSVTSNAATLTVTAAATTPTITTQPSSSTVISGGAASFSVVASGTSPLAYQWKKDGSSISGATSSTYTIASTQTTDAGSYTIVVTNSAGSVTSNPIVLTILAPRLYSLAVRTALEANQILIVGFTMSGGAKNVLLRAAGPTLGAFGVPETMVDPKLDLYRGSTLITSNDNWGGSPSLAATFTSAGAFAYASATSLDAALVASIDGGRTAHVYGPAAGAVLVEGYDVGTGDAQKFTSLSARNRVGTGANILIAGFSLAGEGKRNLLIRAVGPTLGVFGVPSVLTDPKLEIYQGSTKIGENDNWPSTLSTTFSSVGAFGLTAGSRDAAITVSLPAGGYTVQVSGADGGVGEALVEIYELP